MRIAFYAPLKPPTHPVPSGDRRVGRLFIKALEQSGHEVTIASTLRTYEPAGCRERQIELREESNALAQELVDGWTAGRTARPDIWFTYHVYYKAPDWLGPRVTTALGIPYVIAEASYAPKRADGPWALGHAATSQSVSAASLVVCPIRDDMECLESLAEEKLLYLPPFLDTAIYAQSANNRANERKRLSKAYKLIADVPWIIVAAMMREGDKLRSYRKLAVALGQLSDIPFQVLIAGDGPARVEVEKVMSAAEGRTRFLGECEATELANIYAACDLCLWPSVNEAYGMAMLEAQAAGVPVVSQAVRGVPDVVRDGVTGLLSAKDDDAGMALLARELLVDRPRRASMGAAASRFVLSERSLDVSSARLDRALSEVLAKHRRSAADR